MGALMQAYRKAMLSDYTAHCMHVAGAMLPASGEDNMKILVVDDHPLIRSALGQILTDIGEAVELLTCADCASAMATAEATPDLDLILLDLTLPDRSGLEAVRDIRQCCPTVPTVVLSATEDRDVVRAALEAGAMGFIPKTSSNQVMLSALQLVLSGGMYVPPQALVPEKEPARGGTAPPRPDGCRPADIGLTERQADVLALMVQGKPNKLICRELNLAEGTVKIHVTAVLKALDVRNRTQAVIKANRLGLVFGPQRGR
jgi:DNA-binding NarL/FixJ family response regulator